MFFCLSTMTGMMRCAVILCIFLVVCGPLLIIFGIKKMGEDNSRTAEVAEYNKAASVYTDDGPFALW